MTRYVWRNDAFYDRLSVAPRSAVADVADHGRRDAVLRSQRHRAASVSPNGGNIRFGQFRAPVRCSAIERLPSLRLSIGHVVVIRPKEQVRLLNAGRRVAPMANLLSRRDRAVGLRPCQTVRLPNDALPFEMPVSLGVSRANPQATAIRLWSAVVSQPLGQRRLARGACKGQFSSSHDSTPIAVAVRGLRGGANARRPRHCIATMAGLP